MKYNYLANLLLAVLFAFSSAAHADEPFRKHRYSSFQALPACNDGDIVFIGNSITNMMNWYEAFGSRQEIHGRGNSGGYTQEILDNLESMIAGNPSKVFLMIGTNDLGTNGEFYTPVHVADRITQILSRVRAEAPNATVYYESILPSLNGTRTRAKTEETNDSVKVWIARQNDPKIVYVDLYSRLVAEDGSMKNAVSTPNASAYSYDGLHLTQKGYRIWMQAIKDYVGSDCVYPENAPNVWGGLGGSNGMRVTYFGASPVKSTDILLIGDEMIHNGEWHELLGSADFKDRGIGWGYPSVNVSNVAGTFSAILEANRDNGVSKDAPRAVCLYAGLADVQAGSNADAIFANYKTAVSSLRTKLPSTPIFVMTVLPFPSGSATQANTIVALNSKLKTLADETGKVYLIDTYAATFDGTRNEECFMGTGNIYLSGFGYARVSQAIAEAVNAKLGTEYTAISDSEARKNIVRFMVRTAEYNASYTPGTQLGQYAPEAYEAYRTALQEAYNSIDDGNADMATVQAALEEAEATLKAALVLPSAENAGEGHEFQLYTPNRGNYYLTSNGADEGVTGTARNNKNKSRWNILPRTDGTWDIRNVADGSYLLPTANYNTQIFTSEAQPSKGWEFSWCNNAGLYIIQSGDVQLNQTTINAKVYNWSNGGTANDRDDLGCQFRIVDVTDIEADVELSAGNTEVVVDKTNGDLYRDGAVSTGWSSTWRSADGLVTFAASVNNMQWNGNNIDARSGLTEESSYTLSCTEDYVISGFTMNLRSLSSSAQTWNINGKTYTVSSQTEAVTVKCENLNENAISMSLSGANTGTLISDFVVSLRTLTPTYKVDTNNGVLAADGNSSFAATWTSNVADPQVKLFTDTNPSTGKRYNNMTSEGDELVLYGNNNVSFHYNLATPTEGYVITGYEFDYTSLDVDMSVTPDGGGATVACPVGKTAHVSVSGLNTSETGFMVTGGLKRIKTSNFYVYLKAVVETPNDRFVVFRNPSEDGVPYRIPAIAKAQNGDLIAVVDYRYSGADIGMATNGKLDLRFRIKDHATGEWGKVQTLAASRGEGAATVSFGDPCIVADSESNRVMVTSCCGNVSFPAGTHENHQGWARFYSEDGGKTWSDYTDISQQVFDQLDKRSDGNIRCFFIGSGKIVQSTTVKKGDYYRIYCAALVKVGNGTNTNYVFYSDDFGGNWHLLGTPDKAPVPSGADEPKTEELPDGSILVSSRISGGRYYNIFHFTDVLEGEGYWETVAASNKNVNGITASSNACNGETLCIPAVRKADGQKTFLLLQSVPFGPSDRSNVGINYKELTDLSDFRNPTLLSKDWDGTFKVTSLTSAYSTMTLDADNRVAFFYEENYSSNGYDMVYKNYSVEEITGDAYTYAAMTPADSAAYMLQAIKAYAENMEGQFGNMVGQYTDEAQTTINNAVAAYEKQPGHDAYSEFNKAIMDVPQVEVDASKLYALRNCGRSTQTASYVMSAGENYFVGVSESSAPIEDATQHFQFVPTEEPDTYLLYHPASKRYYGRLGNNETQTPHVDDMASAGTFRIESNSYGWSTLYNVNHTGSNAYIHLAGDNSRLVPWGATEPSHWYLIPVGALVGITDATMDKEAETTTVYDLSGRSVSRAGDKGVYIVNGKKVLVK